MQLTSGSFFPRPPWGMTKHLPLFERVPLLLEGEQSLVKETENQGITELMYSSRIAVKRERQRDAFRFTICKDYRF